MLKHFLVWLKVPIVDVSHDEIKEYIEFLLDRRLSAKTINCHLNVIRRFCHYLKEEEGLPVVDPVKRGSALRLPNPLPKHLRDEEVDAFLEVINKPRDQAMFMVMLRCGLRVEEVANLSIDAIDYRNSRLFVFMGKGKKDRVVFISSSAADALAIYLEMRPCVKSRKVFLVEKGTFKGQPISVRGIQKRIEYYSKKSGVSVSCHNLRHTMATQLLNADAPLVSIQDLLGHSKIKTTQRYCRVSNVKMQKDYYTAMAMIEKKSRKEPANKERLH